MTRQNSWYSSRNFNHLKQMEINCGCFLETILSITSPCKAFAVSGYHVTPWPSTPVLGHVRTNCNIMKFCDIDTTLRHIGIMSETFPTISHNNKTLCQYSNVNDNNKNQLPAKYKQQKKLLKPNEIDTPSIWTATSTTLTALPNPI